MIRELKFKHLRDNGDATSNYDVEFTKGLTLRELVEMVLRHAPDEWGYFEIATSPSGVPVRFCDLIQVVEYRCGKIVDIKTELYEKYSDRKIETLAASGGYTRMDYTARVSPTDKDGNVDAPIETVYIPARDEHDGIHGISVKLRWACPICGAPRGEIQNGRSYDGSRVLFCNTWQNPCGHVDKYADVRTEAAANGLNGDVLTGGALNDTLPTARTDNRT